MNKKKKCLFMVFGIILLMISCGYLNVKNNMNFKLYSLDIVSEIEGITDEQLDNLDTDGFDEILDDMTEERKSIFGESFTDKIKAILSGEVPANFSNICELVVSVLASNLTGVVPILATLCAIAILSGIISHARPKTLNKSVNDLVHFACFGVIVVIVFGVILQLVKLTTETLASLKTQMEIGFPILLTLMVAVGAKVSVGVYQPMVAVLSGFMVQFFTNILLPIFVFSIIFSVISNLSINVKLNKFSAFFSSSFKYIIGFVFTIFSAFMAVQGVTAGSYDGVSIRATKFAIKSYVPILGGYISDGFNIVMASSVLIKNAVGVAGLIIMFLTIISPLIKIIIFKLGLSLIAGITEPIADSRVSGFFSNVAKSLNMLTATIIAFGFAYFISVGLIMCTSNAVA